MIDEEKSQGPWKDPIVEEVRQARESIFASAGYDLDALCRRLREKQGSYATPVVTRPPRAPEKSAGEAA